MKEDELKRIEADWLYCVTTKRCPACGAAGADVHALLAEIRRLRHLLDHTVMHQPV